MKLILLFFVLLQVGRCDHFEDRLRDRNIIFEATNQSAYVGSQVDWKMKINLLIDERPVLELQRFLARPSLNYCRQYDCNAPFDTFLKMANEAEVSEFIKSLREGLFPSNLVADSLFIATMATMIGYRAYDALPVIQKWVRIKILGLADDALVVEIDAIKIQDPRLMVYAVRSIPKIENKFIIQDSFPSNLLGRAKYDCFDELEFLDGQKCRFIDAEERKMVCPRLSSVGCNAKSLDRCGETWISDGILAEIVGKKFLMATLNLTAQRCSKTTKECTDFKLKSGVFSFSASKDETLCLRHLRMKYCIEGGINNESFNISYIERRPRMTPTGSDGSELAWKWLSAHSKTILFLSIILLLCVVVTIGVLENRIRKHYAKKV